MDPFSTEAELVNLHTLFHQGQYTQAAEFDTSPLSTENQLAARVLKLRSQIALGDATEVLSAVKGQKAPELQAVGALAEYTSGKKEKALKTIEALVAKEDENSTAQIIAATILQTEGRSDEALALLSKHQGSLDAVALIVQIHLQQNRLDLAQKEVKEAKRWAQDSLLLNLAEAWVGLRVGGDQYQQSYYVFEELAQNPSTSSAQTLIAQGVAELHLGRYEEADAALKQALEKEPQNADALANSIVLAILTGNKEDESSHTSTLEAVDPSHPYLIGSKEMESAFDEAVRKYPAKVAV